jgi:glycosyltransferase involved in cell wall biosynthesis
VEKFIGRCVESLMQQTIDGVEYIFVNDATPYKSMDVLRSVVERYPAKASQVKIVEHEHNKGLPAARNSGMAVATGEYLFHCDSDDYVEPDMLETLYSKALEAGADIVWSDWYLTF